MWKEKFKQPLLVDPQISGVTAAPPVTWWSRAMGNLATPAVTAAQGIVPVMSTASFTSYQTFQDRAVTPKNK